MQWQAVPFVGPCTVVLSLLNGISSEQELIGAYGPERVLYCVAQGMDATRRGGTVEYKNIGQLVFGAENGVLTPQVRAAADFFTRAGVPHTVSPDIRHSQWSKLMLNVGVNQACAVYGCPYAGVQDKSAQARRAMVAAMRETQAVAACEGVALTDEELTDWLALIDTLNPAGMPSMRQDTLAGRPTEKALFAGTVCALGRAHGVPTPVNDAFLAELSALEKACPAPAAPAENGPKAAQEG